MACWSVVVTLLVAHGRTAGWGLGEQAAWYSTLCWWPTLLIFLRLLEPESVWREFPRQQMAFDFANTCWQVHYVTTSLPVLLRSSSTPIFTLYALHPLPHCLPFSHSTFCCTWQVIESWVGAWKQGYHSLTLLSHVLFTNGLAECGCVCLWIRRHWTERAEKVLGHDLLRVWTPLSRVSHNLRVTTTIMLLWWWCCYGD